MWNTIRRTLTSLLAATCLTNVNPVWSQLPLPMPVEKEHDAVDANPIVAELRELQAKIEQIHIKLAQIARDAEKENPQLVKQQNDLMKLFQAKLKEYNYPSEEELQKLQEMQSKLLTANDLEEKERQKLMGEFQSTVMALQEAQQRAQQDPEVQKSFKELEVARTRAMRAIDATTPELMKEQEELFGKMQLLYVQLQQQMQLH